MSTTTRRLRITALGVVLAACRAAPSAVVAAPSPPESTPVTVPDRSEVDAVLDGLPSLSESLGPDAPPDPPPARVVPVRGLPWRMTIRFVVRPELADRDRAAAEAFAASLPPRIVEVDGAWVHLSGEAAPGQPYEYVIGPGHTWLRGVATASGSDRWIHIDHERDHDPAEARREMAELFREGIPVIGDLAPGTDLGGGVVESVIPYDDEGMFVTFVGRDVGMEIRVEVPADDIDITPPDDADEYAD